MDFLSFTTTALLAVSGLLGVGSMPESTSATWSVSQPWKEIGDSVVLKMVSTKIVEECAARPDAHIVFPAVVHGAHEVRLDGRIVGRFGDPSFRSVRSFYGAPFVACQGLGQGSSIEWTVYSYSRYFSRIADYPTVDDRALLIQFFRETLIAVSAGLLVVMALMSFILFFGKVGAGLAWSSSLANLFFAGFFLLSVSEFFGINLPMLLTHKLADTSIFIGVALFFNTLRLRGIIPVSALGAFLTTIVLTISIFAFASTGDQVQFATTLTFPVAMLLMIWSLAQTARQLRNEGITRDRALQFLSLAFFIGAIVNEMLMVLGIADSYPFLAVGTVGALMFSALSANEKIVDAYRERDYLRENLENEVDRKTLELRQKSEELEVAMQELRSTQAELVQSAKLASLGTLSAGIAHEINNSLNYVNGALKPLQKLVARDEPPRAKISALIATMQDGLGLTFKIIDSLRSYTFNNQAAMTDLSAVRVVGQALTILASRIRKGYHLDISVSESHYVVANETSINQVLINIINNALDAMPDGGTLRISSMKLDDEVSIVIEDSGPGIPDAIKSRIFEPFFTTKEVGQGTGLGMHIVHQEMLRNNGRINIESPEAGGTRVVLSLRAGCPTRLEEEAAA